MRTAVRKRKAERVDTAPALRDRVRRQLSAAANAKPASHDDPLYSVTETFQQEFRRVGRQRADAGEDRAQSDKETPGEERRQEKRDPLQAEGKKEGAEPPQREGQAPKARKPEAEERTNAAPMRKFSKMAFQRGELSASLLEGTGKIALVSSLKRAVGKTERSATLFGLGAQTDNVPARDPDKMMYYRNFANGAVGLVVDALRDARQSVESLADMASGSGGLREQDGGATLRAMYPFLDDSRERELLAERRERLKGDCTAEERAILENAAVRAEALIAKKARMKEDFIQKLREVSDRAAQALAELEAPETLEEIAQALMEPDAPNPPPDGGPPDGGAEESATVDISDGGAEESATVEMSDGGAEESATVEMSDGGAEESATVEMSDSGAEESATVEAGVSESSFSFFGAEEGATVEMSDGGA